MKQYYNEQVYNEIDKLIFKLEKKINNKIFSYYGFSDKEIIKRIVQKAMHKCLFSYTKHVNNSIKFNKDPFENTSILKLNGLHINLKNGDFKLSYKEHLFNLLKYSYLILGTIFFIVKAFFKKKRKTNLKYVLIFDEILNNTSKKVKWEEFSKFCREGNIPILKKGLVIIKNHNHYETDKFKFLIGSQFPIYSLLNDSRISFFNLIKLIFEYLISFVYSLYYCLKSPETSIILTDFATIPLIKFFNNKNLLDSLVITTSSIHSQPLWMRNFNKKIFKTHFINYSDNSEKFIYKEFPLYHDYPAIRHICVDVQWVWSENQKKMYLNSGHKGSINLVGPITFSNQSTLLKKNKDVFKITIFDIYPFLTSKIENLGVVKYYYKTKIVLKFIQDIIELCEKISDKLESNIEIYLKSKRQFYKEFHDPIYLSELEKLRKKHNIFNISSFEENIYNFTNNSNLSISIPYTSTAHVTSSLNIESLYYDPSGKLFREINDNIIFINNKNNLYELIKNLVLKDIKKLKTK